MIKRHRITPELRHTIILLRRSGFKPPQIKEILDKANEQVSLRYVYILVKGE